MTATEYVPSCIGYRFFSMVILNMCSPARERNPLVFYPLHYFGFDEELIYTYSTGRCWYLVHALMERTGLEPIAFWAEGLIHHVGLLLPDETVVDVIGIWDKSSWEGKWTHTLAAGRGNNIPYGVSLRPPTVWDEYWRKSRQHYDAQDMLNEELYLSRTLGQMTDAISSLLVAKNLIPPIPEYSMN